MEVCTLKVLRSWIHTMTPRLAITLCYVAIPYFPDIFLFSGYRSSGAPERQRPRQCAVRICQRRCLKCPASLITIARTYK